MTSLPSRAAAPQSDNCVFLRGRLAAAAEVRTLPSGDELLSFRLTVDRAADEAAGRRAAVDSIDCTTTRPKVRRLLERSAPGARLEVSGALHRRFWRSPSGPASRYQVRVEDARAVRLPAADRAAGARAPRLRAVTDRRSGA